MSGASFMVLLAKGAGVNIIFQAGSAPAAAGTVTLTSQPFGTASADRYIIIAFSERWAGAQSITSVTIGGVSATLVATATNSAGGNTTVTGVYIAAVPTGTSGTVSIVLSAAGNRPAFALWSMTGAGSITPTATATSVATNPTGNINVNANGGAIGAIYDGLGSGTATAWTGLTEDYDAITAGSEYSGAHISNAAASTPLAVTATVTGGTNGSGVFASWGP